MRAAPLISDFRDTPVEQEVEFGRTPEFSFTANWLTDDETRAKAGCASKKPQIIHFRHGQYIYPKQVSARIFLCLDFGRIESVIRAMDRAGYRPALLCEGESLIAEDGFWECLNRKRYFPLCCIGTVFQYYGQEKYFAYLSQSTEGDFPNRQDVEWRLEGTTVLTANYSFLGIKKN